MLALRGGAELVALWAQVGSIIDVVVGVVAAGVGSGLVVYVARARKPKAQRQHLAEALRIGLRTALPVTLAVAAAAWVCSDQLSGGRISASIFAIAAFAGWAAVIPMLVSNYWLGMDRRGLMLALVIAQSALAVVASVAAPVTSVLLWLTLTQALPALVLLLLPTREAMSARFQRWPHPLRRYILPGLSIGILSPVSMLLTRGIVGDALSWHEAGVLQALWRVSDWVCTLAGGYLSFHYLPRFAAARSQAELLDKLRSAAKVTLAPCAIAFGGLLATHGPLLAVLYDPGMRASDVTAGLIFAGSLVRVASWVPLLALYTMRRTYAIALAELLSLPLFAMLMLATGRHLSLELAGVLWLLSYAAYAAFNLAAVLRGHGLGR